MQTNPRLTLAIQRKGRLSDSSLSLLARSGLRFEPTDNALICSAQNFPVDILLVRDDDIPTFVKDGVSDLGIVGENVLQEQAEYTHDFEKVKSLGFGQCRLSIALPTEIPFTDIQQLQNKRIATSYPKILRQFLLSQQMDAKVISISGSVEIAPRLNMAEAICDLVATGKTLAENNLKEVFTILESQAALVKTSKVLSTQKKHILNDLLQRLDGVLAC